MHKRRPIVRQRLILITAVSLLGFAHLRSVSKLHSAHLTDLAYAFAALEEVLLEQRALLGVEFPGGEDGINSTALLRVAFLHHETKQVASSCILAARVKVLDQGSEALACQPIFSEPRRSA